MQLVPLGGWILLLVAYVLIAFSCIVTASQSRYLWVRIARRDGLYSRCSPKLPFGLTRPAVLSSADP